VALARALFRKGANFAAAMAFEVASTNLVLELSIIMLVFLGWQFTLAEFIGAPVMVGLLVVLFRRFLNRELLEEARAQADKGIAGRMEGHAEMDMSVTEGSLWQRLISERGLTAVSHYFVMDWAAVWLDIVGGLLMAGALAAMAGAALIVELIFGALDVIPRCDPDATRARSKRPSRRTTRAGSTSFFAAAALLVWRFLKTGGPAMLRMMNRPAATGHSH
jgi:uncharacterized membrane protein YraQ (UPF0718 family)